MENGSLDIVVIGGGIVGLGIAAELTRRGRSVDLYEKDKINSKASGNSLRIIHGGLRYLQNLDVFRTLESARAQTDLLKAYPEHIKALSCLMPLDRTGLKSKSPVAIGLNLYRLMSKLTNGRDPGGSVINRQAALKHSNLLEGIVDYGALKWFDAYLLDPDEFSKHLCKDLISKGAKIHENSLVEVLHADRSSCEIRVNSKGQSQTLSPNLIIDASGAWVSISSGTNKTVKGWCKAYNIVLNRQLEPEVAIGLKSKQGRLYFLVPRDEVSVLGTFYSPLDSDLDDLAVSEADVEAHLREFNKLCPAAKLSLSDVDSLDLGVLPLAKVSKAEVEPQGKEQVLKDGNLVTVVSTKYTSFQVLARKVADSL